MQRSFRRLSLKGYQFGGHLHRDGVRRTVAKNPGERRLRKLVVDIAQLVAFHRQFQSSLFDGTGSHPECGGGPVRDGVPSARGPLTRKIRRGAQSHQRGGVDRHPGQEPPLAQFRYRTHRHAGVAATRWHRAHIDVLQIPARHLRDPQPEPHGRRLAILWYMMQQQGCPSVPSVRQGDHGHARTLGPRCPGPILGGHVQGRQAAFPSALYHERRPLDFHYSTLSRTQGHAFRRLLASAAVVQRQTSSPQKNILGRNAG